MKKIKKLLQKPFVKNIVAPVVRGALKTVPGGGIAVEVVNNYLHEKTEEAPVKPHNYLSIAVQVIGIAAIVWAFYTKAITIEQLLSLLGLK